MIHMTYKIILAIASITILSGCSSKMKEKIGMVTTGPNEYQVQTNKPLDVPPHYDLPPPTASASNTKKK